MLIRIANDPNILRYADNGYEANKGGPVLPNDRAVLTELCGLKVEEFDDLVERSVIHPDMRRGEIRLAITAAAHGPPAGAALGQIQGDPRGPALAGGRRGGAGGLGKAPEAKYPTMTADEIAALSRRGELAADDCVLFLWQVPHLAEEAYGVIRAWGFRYVTSALCLA